MFEPYLQNLWLIRQEALVGGAVILLAVVPGWWLGREPRRWAVRLVGWWLDQIVRPLLASRWWLRRAVTIAANNTAVCAGMVVLGALGPVAWIAVASVGLGLGIALRQMIGIDVPEEERRAEQPTMPRAKMQEAIGVALNLLEIPAIMVAAGLSLAQGAMSSVLELPGAVVLFASVVIPLLIVSAAGEALWMGVNPLLSQSRPHGHHR